MKYYIDSEKSIIAIHEFYPDDAHVPPIIKALMVEFIGTLFIQLSGFLEESE